MPYQLDTNILLEFLLDQEKADDVERLLRVIPHESLFVTEFSVHSVGVILCAASFMPVSFALSKTCYSPEQSR